MLKLDLRPGRAKCLKCGKEFDSRDVTTNRICTPCSRINLREYIRKPTGSRIYSDGHHGTAIDHDGD